MYRSRQILIAVIVIATAVVLAACASPSSTGGKDTVTLQNIAFNPDTLTVKSGVTVTFKNDDTVEHHIVVGTDDLGVQQPGQTKTWKASKDGVYRMRCIIHPSMQGQITVGAGGSTIGTGTTGGGSMGTSSTGGGSSGGSGY